MIDHVFILLAALYAVLRGLKTLHPDAEFDASNVVEDIISQHICLEHLSAKLLWLP